MDTPFSNPKRPGIDLTNEDGTPMEWAIGRFERGIELLEHDTRPGALEKLKGPIEMIKRLFLRGDTQKLISIARNTAAGAYKERFSLADAQILNDYAIAALSNLIRGKEFQPLERVLAYHYQSHVGQSSGETDRANMAAAAGAYGPEAQLEAQENIRRKNPTDEELKVGQDAVVEEILRMIGPLN